MNILATLDPDRVKTFSALMQSILSCPDMSASKSWFRIQEKIYQNALKSFVQQTHAKKYRFEENINGLLSLIKVKRPAHIEYQHNHNRTSLNRLREARNVFRRTVRKYANELKTFRLLLTKATPNKYMMDSENQLDLLNS